MDTNDDTILPSQLLDTVSGTPGVSTSTNERPKDVPNECGLHIGVVVG